MIIHKRIQGILICVGLMLVTTVASAQVQDKKRDYAAELNALDAPAPPRPIDPWLVERAVREQQERYDREDREDREQLQRERALAAITDQMNDDRIEREREYQIKAEREMAGRQRDLEQKSAEFDAFLQHQEAMRVQQESARAIQNELQSINRTLQERPYHRY